MSIINVLPNHSPMATADTHITALNSAYPPASVHCEAFTIASISAEKVEKVVNPPQNPVTPRKMSQLYDVSDMKKPISSDPAKFTIVVDTGKAVESGRDAIPTDTR